MKHFLFHFLHADQSTFKTHPQDFVGFSNSPATFNCTYDDEEYSIAPNILWELNDSELPRNDPAKYSIFSYKYTSFLQINELSSLRCQISTVRCVVHSKSGNNVYSDYATLNISGLNQLASCSYN